MSLFLHKSLCDLSKGDSSGSADKTGEQRGGKYFHRIQTGYGKNNAPTYRYFKTEEEFSAYSSQQTKEEKTKKQHEKTTKEGAKRLKDKVESEQQQTSEKQKDSLFIKDKNKKIQKSLYIVLEAS